MTGADIQSAIRSLAYLRTPDKVRAGLANTYGVKLPIERVQSALSVIHAEGSHYAKVAEPKESDAWDYDFRFHRNSRPQAKPQIVKPERPALRQREPLPKSVPAPSPNPFVGAFMFKALAASIASDFGTTVDDICGGARFRRLILPRIVLTKLCLEQGMSSKAIGRKMGGRDHTTILNQRDSFHAYAKKYPAIRESYERHAALRDEARAIRAAREAREAQKVAA